MNTLLNEFIFVDKFSGELLKVKDLNKIIILKVR